MMLSFHCILHPPHCLALLLAKTHPYSWQSKPGLCSTTVPDAPVLPSPLLLRRSLCPPKAEITHRGYRKGRFCTGLFYRGGGHGCHLSPKTHLCFATPSPPSSAAHRAAGVGIAIRAKVGKDGLGRPPASRQRIASLSHRHQRHLHGVFAISLWKG